MSTIRKNLKFDDEDDRAKLVLEFLSYIPRRQADFITDLIFCHLEKCGVADPAKLNKKVVDSITRNVYKDAAEYGSKQSSEVAALIDLMSKMMNQAQGIRAINQNEKIVETPQNDFDLSDLKETLIRTKSDQKNEDVSIPSKEPLPEEKYDKHDKPDEIPAKILETEQNDEQDVIAADVLEDDQDEVPNDLNEYFEF